MQEFILIEPGSTAKAEWTRGAERAAVRRDFEKRLADCAALAFRVARGVLRNDADAEDVAALLRYEALLRRTPATAIQIAAANPLDLQFRIEPLEIAEIELGELKISSLIKSDSEGDMK